MTTATHGRIGSKARRRTRTADGPRRAPADRARQAGAASTDREPSLTAWHESGHAVIASQMGARIDSVSVRAGVAFSGLTILLGTSFDSTGLSGMLWWLSPDLERVVRELHYLLAGAMSEGLGTSSRPVFVDADAARAAFEGLPESTRTSLVAAEGAGEVISDEARAWAHAVNFAGPDASQFLNLVTPGVRRLVLEHAPSIATVAAELDRGSVLSGLGVATIIGAGEPVDGDDARPRSGTWTPIAMAHIATFEEPVRMGDVLPWHDPRIQRSPGLFIPADADADVIHRAVAAHRSGARSPDTGPTPRLKPGPGVVRAIRGFVRRSRNGVPVRVAAGSLARTTAWYVRRWPDEFEESVLEGALRSSKGKA
jgi:hypothetical protein